MILNVSARSGENCILVPYNWKTACECQLREKLCVGVRWGETSILVPDKGKTTCLVPDNCLILEKCFMGTPSVNRYSSVGIENEACTERGR